MRIKSVGYNIRDVHVASSTFDKAVCEARAVSKFTGSPYTLHYKGYST